MVGSLSGPKHRGIPGFYDQNRKWVTFPDLLPDDERIFPETVPLEYLKTHRIGCECRPCTTYPNQRSLYGLKIRCAALRRE